MEVLYLNILLVHLRCFTCVDFDLCQRSKMVKGINSISSKVLLIIEITSYEEKPLKTHNFWICEKCDRDWLISLYTFWYKHVIKRAWNMIDNVSICYGNSMLGLLCLGIWGWFCYVIENQSICLTNDHAYI